MSVILFDDRCSPCVRKQLWKQLKARAAEKRVLITRVDVSKSKEESEKAMSHNMALPFIIEDDKVKSAEEWLND